MILFPSFQGEYAMIYPCIQFLPRYFQDSQFSDIYLISCTSKSEGRGWKHHIWSPIHAMSACDTTKFHPPLTTFQTYVDNIISARWFHLPADVRLYLLYFYLSLIAINSVSFVASAYGVRQLGPQHRRSQTLRSLLLTQYSVYLRRISLFPRS